MKKLYSRSYDVRNTLHLYARDRSKRFLKEKQIIATEYGLLYY